MTEEEKISIEIAESISQIIKENDEQLYRLRIKHVIILSSEVCVFLLLLFLCPLSNDTYIIVYKLVLLIIHSAFVYVLHIRNKKKMSDIFERNRRALDILIKIMTF